MGVQVTQDMSVAARDSAKDFHAVRDHVADAAGLHGATGCPLCQWQQSGITSQCLMSDWEWAVGSGDLRGQVKVGKAARDGVEGSCLGGNGEVPGYEWEWGEARVGPS